jgi:hypothetical protein
MTMLFRLVSRSDKPSLHDSKLEIFLCPKIMSRILLTCS